MSYKTLVMILFSLVTISCAETTPPQLLETETPGINEPDDIVDMPQGVHWREEIAIFEFDAEDAANWNYDIEGRILMPDEYAEDVDGMKAGDVLIAWEAYIFFVKEITTTDEGIEILVKRFSVGDAIYGEFDIPIVEPEQSGIGEVSTPKITMDLSTFGNFPASVSAQVTSADLDFPVSTDGAFKGKIPKISGYRCEGETVHGYCVDYLMAKLTLGFDAHLDMNFTAALALEFATADPPPPIAAIQRLNSRILQIPLGATGLAIQPQFEIPRQISLSFSGEAELGFMAQASARLPLGFEYFNKGYQGHRNSDFSWMPNARHPATFDKEFTPTASGSGKVVLHQHIGIGIGFRIVPAVSSSVGLSGLGFAATLNEDFTYDRFKPNNCLEAKLTVKFSAKAQIKFFIDSWVGEWEWTLLDRTGSAEGGRAIAGSIPIGKPIELAKVSGGTQFCGDAGTAKNLRITRVTDEPGGLADGNGYELDAVQVSRTSGSGINQTTETWEATGATGGGNSNAATGVPDAKTCSEFSNKVAAVASSITLTFDKSFKPGDVVNVFQYLPGNEIGPDGDCYPSGSIKIEVGNGSAWNTVIEQIAGNAVVTIEGTDLSF